MVYSRSTRMQWSEIIGRLDYDDDDSVSVNDADTCDDETDICGIPSGRLKYLVSLLLRYLRSSTTMFDPLFRVGSLKFGIIP